MIFLKNAYLRLKDAFEENLKKNKTLKSQVPNILTCSRALTPLIVTPLVLTGNVIPGLIAGAILASTDFFDGKLARKWHAESEFGTLIDPIVDKIFAVTLLLTGAALNPFILLNIVPEIAISVKNAQAFNDGKTVKTSLIGKLKTWLLSINILLSFLPGATPMIRGLATFATFITQSIAYIDYSEKIDNQKKDNKKTEIINIIDEFDKREKTLNKEKSISKSSQIRNKKIELLKYKKSLLLKSKDLKKDKQKIKSIN